MTPDVYDLGSKRELFADDFFIGTLLGNCQRRINNPLPDDIVFTLDEEHEKCNSSSCFNSIIFDGKRYLFYYRTGLNLPTKNNPESREEACLCVAESYDGINFKRCQVNLFKSGYNVVLDTTKTRHLTPAHLTDICPAVTTAFYDTNPACPENEKYKLIVTNERPPASDERGMYLFVSADGFDFHQKTGKFKLDERSGYDSANQAFLTITSANTDFITAVSNGTDRIGKDTFSPMSRKILKLLLTDSILNLILNLTVILQSVRNFIQMRYVRTSVRRIFCSDSPCATMKAA